MPPKLSGAPKPKDHISYSEITTFLQCRRLWGYRYYHRVYPKLSNKNFLLGTAVHRALAQYYDPEDKQAQDRGVAAVTRYYDEVEQTYNHIREVTGAEPEDDIQEALSTGGDMMVQYVAWAPQNDTWESRGVEVHVSAPVIDNISLVGYIDLLAWEPEEQASWIVDHKTYAQFRQPDANSVFLDLQGTVYMWAVMQDEILRGKGFQGIIYNMLSKRPPSFPKQLKNGQLSKNKAQRTTPELYTQRVLELGLDLKDYEDFIATMTGADRFNKRLPIAVSDARLNWFDKYIRVLAHIIANTYDAGEVALLPTISRRCDYCEYAPLCKRFMEGIDWRTMEEQFVYDPKHNVTVEEDED